MVTVNVLNFLCFACVRKAGYRRVRIALFHCGVKAARGYPLTKVVGVLGGPFRVDNMTRSYLLGFPVNSVPLGLG